VTRFFPFFASSFFVAANIIEECVSPFTGTYDYRGGILQVSQDGDSGVRLSAVGSGGVGGVGRFIMRNPGPTSPGHVRSYDFDVAANEVVKRRMMVGK
jgi:hypothetical protein